MWIITAPANFFTFGAEALKVPRGSVLRGNAIVSSTAPFNYFLGKSWSALIYCVLSPINVHGFLKLADGVHVCTFLPLLYETALMLHL